MLNKILVAIFSLLVLHFASSIQAETISGYEFVKPETRIMQDNELENPGFFSVTMGQELFVQEHGENKQSCASCHGQTGEKLDTNFSKTR